MEVWDVKLLVRQVVGVCSMIFLDVFFVVTDFESFILPLAYFAAADGEGFDGSP